VGAGKVGITITEEGNGKGKLVGPLGVQWTTKHRQITREKRRKESKTFIEVQTLGRRLGGPFIRGEGKTGGEKRRKNRNHKTQKREERGGEANRKRMN